MPRPSSRAFCAVISANFLPSAFALAESLAETNPGVLLFVFFVDTAETAGALPPNVRLVSQREWNLPPNKRRMFSYYDAFELCNALRPEAIRFLFDTHGFRKVIYLDTDIWVTGSFAPLWKGLDAAAFGFSPHLQKPHRDDHQRPSELAFLHYGTYNSGFLAFRNVRRAREALALWSDRLERYAFFDPPLLHGGQEYLDLLALFYRDVFWPITHPGANIAYWNLETCQLSRRHGQLYSNGQKAIFFHLSGFDPRTPHRFTRFPGRHTFASQPILKSVCDAYGRALRKHSPIAFPTHPKFEESPTAKAKRRWQFVYGSLKGYSWAKGRKWCDPRAFSQILLNIPQGK